jgi:hypothetical protein
MTGLGRGVTTGVWLLAIAGGLASFAQTLPPASPMLGALATAILRSGELTPADIARAPEAARPRVRTFAARAAAFRPAPAPGESPERNRHVVERAIVALFDRPGIEQFAASYAASAVISLEWEGSPDGPLKEAAYAEAYLKKDPRSLLAPYLYLFLAHRHRAAFEAAAYRQRQHQENTLEAQKSAARKYRAFLERARGVSADVIFPLAAADLDGQKYVYLDVGLHPGTFNPDG